MTGPEHYRAAEKLLLMPSPDEGHIAKAQAHATLAIVAAVAVLAAKEYQGTGADSYGREWARAVT